MKKIIEAAVVIHNMIVEIRRDNYNSDESAGRSSHIDQEHPLNDIMFIRSCPWATPLFSRSSVAVSEDIKVRGLQRDLHRPLIEHQWISFARNKNIFVK